MSILQSLKFAQGAVKKNKINPELEHYQISAGRIVGFNGYMALGAPIDLAIEAHPKADLFFKAIEACGDSLALSLSAAGRLNIKSGRFSAVVPCVDAVIYEAWPAGEVYDTPVGFAAACRRLLPLISEDASRPWAMGLCCHKGCLQATNNIIIMQEWVGGNLPSFNCPRFAVAELARIGEEPTSIQVSKSDVVFHFADGRWLQARQLSDEWPYALVDRIIETADYAAVQPVPEDLFEALATMAPFVPAETTAVRFEGGALSTGDGLAGASMEMEGLPDGPVFSMPMLRLLEGRATHVAFSSYPDPCAIVGPNRRGVILGLRN